jgi:peroxiredoxin
VLWSTCVAATLSVVAASGFTLPAAAPNSPNSTDAPASTAASSAPTVGDRAPDFDYQSYDFRWVRFHNMLQRDSVILVFSPDETTLSGLEAEREQLAERGVAPVAVLDERDAAVWRRVSRLGLAYSLLSDPRGVIAQGFGAWDAATGRPVPAWYVVGGDGKIRASGRGQLPASELASTALQALGLEAPRQETPPSAAN